MQTNPMSGRVGRIVTIMGADLKGSTSVRFNGTVCELHGVQFRHLYLDRRPVRRYNWTRSGGDSERHSDQQLEFSGDSVIADVA